MKYLFRNLCFAALTALCAVVLAACEDDDTKSGDLQLFYPTVVDIGPSMNFVSGTPTYYGPAPSDFSIAGVTLDDQAFATECFSIGADTGMVTISNTESLVPGTYKLTIACQAGGGVFRFKDIFVVRMVPATPEAVEVNTPTLVIPYAELKSSKASVRVAPVGESVSILNYSLVQAKGVEYFTISKSGVVTFNAAFKGEVMPGHYPLPVKIETYAGSATYDNLLTASITSEPLEVRYPSSSGRMEYNKAFQGSTPVLKGSPDEVVWAIKQVNPAEGTAPTDKIKIDPATGVVSVDADSGLPIDASYTLDLTVQNSFGTTDFEGAYTLNVIKFIAPIESDSFGYEPVSAIQGGAFKAPRKAGFVGDEVTFSLGEVPAEVRGQISVDRVTGEVSAAKGHSIPKGVYAIRVKASNLKGEAETTLTLTVNENPYYFTTISYGNNLGLAPAERYASQFHFASGKDFTPLTPTTDAKPGTKLSWSIRIKHQCSGTQIDSETGAITPSGFKTGNGGLVLVTATAGKGEVGETSVTVPVFFSFHVAESGVTVRYKPFVMQVNPRRGGVSVVPEISGAPSLSLFLMDYRRTFNYYNIGGPASHKDGTPASGTDTFLYQMWKSYYNSIGSATVGTGSKDPISYYVNASRLGSALAYVEPADKTVVVNANKWIDANNVAANGAFFAQMTFVTNGNSGKINSGSQIFPIWIWFDEKF
ncbi:surface glycan-binding family protein [Alistipes sp.]|uniref:surface glycan-binding family protein n=1 Tax=Alistipes sp. TaxID=1872444 RepID=UPI0025BF2C4C|nr:surface glycan-binding family protein [Alistipes sp.]